MGGGHGFNQVFFDNVRVPARNLVGGLDQGWYVLAAALDFERSGVSYSVSGRRTLEDLAKHCREATHDGAPLSQDPLVRNRLVNAAIELDVSRWLAYKVAWMQTHGQIPNSEASMSKVFGSEMLVRLANTSMEILGLYGQLDRDSRWAPADGRFMKGYLGNFAQPIAGGTSEIQRNIIATRGLGLPRA